MLWKQDKQRTSELCYDNKQILAIEAEEKENKNKGKLEMRSQSVKNGV